MPIYAKEISTAANSIKETVISLRGGDDEIIAWEEFWEIPGEKEPLTIYTKNEDEYYDHAVLIRIVTKYRKELIAELIANAVFKKFKAFVNAVIAALGFATQGE